ARSLAVHSPLHRWDGNTADREAHKVVAVGETAARHACDARLAKKREDVLARFELAPVIDSTAIVGVHLEAEAVLLVHAQKRVEEAGAEGRVECTNAVTKVRALGEELDLGHIAQLPGAVERGGTVGPARADSRSQLRIAKADPAAAVARDRMR